MSDEMKKVLIADDEEDVHEFVHAVLDQDCITFLDSFDGEDAVQKALAGKPDLVILDVQMPKKDGFQVFAELQKNETTAAIPVIMLTSVNARTGLKFDAKDMGEFLNKEPAAFIDKPIEPEKLQETARGLLGL